MAGFASCFAQLYTLYVSCTSAVGVYLVYGSLASAEHKANEMPVANKDPESKDPSRLLMSAENASKAAGGGEVALT